MLYGIKDLVQGNILQQKDKNRLKGIYDNYHLNKSLIVNNLGQFENQLDNHRSQFYLTSF